MKNMVIELTGALVPFSYLVLYMKPPYVKIVSLYAIQATSIWPIVMEPKRPSHLSTRSIEKVANREQQHQLTIL
jgi:hypothetical protein